MRYTKIVCTIGPATNNFEKIEQLADAGMNVARLNMSHGDYDWHGDVIQSVKSINEKAQHSIAIMLDTKGPEIRSGDLKQALRISKGQTFTFTIRHLSEPTDEMVGVNYDGFIHDVEIGDTILVDGGILSFKVKKKNDKDVICECMDEGTLTSRRHLNVRGRSASLPSITEKDWQDIDFGLEQGIDFIALSFVKNGNAIRELKQHLQEKNQPVDIIAKIESVEAVKNLEEIIAESDGVMVARGDLGAEIPFEEVPIVQEKIIELCRAVGKPVIVATQLLESMMELPTPTRAEVMDISQAVKQGTDAIMLSGETASGKYPIKAVKTMDQVARRREQDLRERHEIAVYPAKEPKEEITLAAAAMNNHLQTKALLVFTRSGHMAAKLSQHRPSSPIYAFTNTTHVRRRLNLAWGIHSFRIKFSSDPEKTIQRAITILVEKELLKSNDTITLVSDILVENEFIHTIQLRTIGEETGLLFKD